MSEPVSTAQRTFAERMAALPAPTAEDMAAWMRERDEAASIRAADMARHLRRAGMRKRVAFGASK